MKDPKKFKIIYLGTPEIAIKPLERLAKDFNVTAVFCQPDKEKGRGKKIEKSPVKIAAEKLGIPTFQPENKNELKNLIEDISPDLAIVFAYGMIIPKKLLESVPKGFLNIHPSLLPKYRGSSPIQYAILNGDKETGVSIIKLVEEVDAGPVLNVEIIKINPRDTAGSLGERLSLLGASLIAKTVNNILDNKEDFVSQDHTLATFTKKIAKNDGKIDWGKPALEIEREIRAYNPWPGSFAHWENKQLKIISATTSKENTGLKPGTVKIDDARISIQTGDGTLVVNYLQLEGKKPTEIKDFLNGYNSINNAVLK